MRQQASHESRFSLIALIPAARKLAALGVVGMTLSSPAMAASGDTAPADPSYDMTPSMQDVTPHLELSSEDDGTISSDDEAGVMDMLAKAKEMGATHWRIMIHPSETMKDPKNPAIYDWTKANTAIRRVDTAGLTPSIMLTGEGVQWSTAKWGGYATAFAANLNNMAAVGFPAKEVAFLNEHNYGSNDVTRSGTWLNPMPGYTTAQTYRKFYKIAYPIIKNGIPGSTVLMGEQNSKGAIASMKAVAKCLPEEGPNCAPLRADGVSTHPYQLKTAPDMPSKDPNENGIGSLAEIEAELQQEFEDGRVKTPDGKKPKLYLTEMAYMEKSDDDNIPDKQKVRYLSSEQRKQYYRRVYKIACLDPNVARLNLYGFRTPPKEWEGTWNSPMMDSTGNMLGTYLVIKNLTAKYSQCVED